MRNAVSEGTIAYGARHEGEREKVMGYGEGRDVRGYKVTGKV